MVAFLGRAWTDRPSLGLPVVDRGRAVPGWTISCSSSCARQVAVRSSSLAVGRVFGLRRLVSSQFSLAVGFCIESVHIALVSLCIFSVHLGLLWFVSVRKIVRAYGCLYVFRWFELCVCQVGDLYVRVSSFCICRSVVFL